MKKNIKNELEKLLKANKEGLTIQDISNLLNLNRITISIYLAELRGENKIKIRKVGQAKLHYLK